MVLCGLIVTVLAGCADDSAQEAGRPEATSGQAETSTPGTADSSATTAPTTTTSSVPPGLDDELDRLLLARPPAGFRPDTGPEASGPIDLAAAAAAESDPAAERSVLVTRGFRRGRARTWRGPAEASVVAVVYRFGDAAGAAAYLADGLVTLDGFGAQRFDVPAVPGAQGFTIADPGGARPTVVHGVAFSSGADFFLLTQSSTDSSTTPDDARQLAASQADLLA